MLYYFRLTRHQRIWRDMVWGLAMKALRMLGCMAVVTIPLMADLALAQGNGPPVNPPVGGGGGLGPGNGQGQMNAGPAPLIGVGLPMAAGVVLAILLARRFRPKR